MSEQRFRINSPTVVEETIEGEVVVVNLDNGNYYSLENTSSEVWQLVKQGARPGQICKFIASRYSEKDELVEEPLAKFLSELQQEGLIVADDSAATIQSTELVLEVLSTTPTAFSAPVLEKYSDMQELLLLDPVHEVSDSGWPSTN